MSKRSSLTCKVHLEGSGYSEGTIKFTYTLLWPGKPHYLCLSDAQIIPYVF